MRPCGVLTKFCANAVLGTLAVARIKSVAFMVEKGNESLVKTVGEKKRLDRRRLSWLACLVLRNMFWRCSVEDKREIV